MATAPPWPHAAGWQHASNGLNTVLCLDTSSGVGASAIGEMKSACHTFIRGVADNVARTSINENVSIIVFGGRTRVLAPLTCDYNRLHAIVDTLAADGSTQMAEALRLAGRELAAHAREVHVHGVAVSPRIILLTDGRPAEGTRQQVINMAYALGPGHASMGLTSPVPIACIACGTNADNGLLEMLAQITKGMYCQMATMAELPSIFSRQALLLLFVNEYGTNLATLARLETLRAFLRARGERAAEQEVNALFRFLLTMVGMVPSGESSTSSSTSRQPAGPATARSDDAQRNTAIGQDGFLPQPAAAVALYPGQVAATIPGTAARPMRPSRTAARVAPCARMTPEKWLLFSASALLVLIGVVGVACGGMCLLEDETSEDKASYCSQLTWPAEMAITCSGAGLLVLTLLGSVCYQACKTSRTERVQRVAAVEHQPLLHEAT